VRFVYGTRIAGPILIIAHLAHVEGWLLGLLIAALVAWGLLRRHSAKA
jgi:hypothetical protein